MRATRLILSLIFLLAAVATGCASADTTTTGEAAHTVPQLSWEQVTTKVAAGGVIVDARGADSFAEGHIDGAINIPWKSAEAYSALPSDKATPVVFYCGGPACSASNKGAMAAVERGYTDVAEYKGGYPEWKKLTAAE